MIAYNAAVYTFKNGFYRAGVFVPETYDVDNFGSIGVATPGFAVGKFTDSTSDPNDFCTSADPAYPITYDNPGARIACAAIPASLLCAHWCMVQLCVAASYSSTACLGSAFECRVSQQESLYPPRFQLPRVCERLHA